MVPIVYAQEQCGHFHMATGAKQNIHRCEPSLNPQSIINQPLIDHGTTIILSITNHSFTIHWPFVNHCLLLLRFSASGLREWGHHECAPPQGSPAWCAVDPIPRRNWWSELSQRTDPNCHVWWGLFIHGLCNGILPHNAWQWKVMDLW